MYPYTKSGYNMYDMMSMLQKAIRRADYELAGFAAFQLASEYRTVLWNRLLIISAEDCFGIITKEIVKLRNDDKSSNNNRNIANAVYLLSSAKKSRDACYFACNFVLSTRKPRELDIGVCEIKDLINRIGNGECSSNEQMTLFTECCQIKNDSDNPDKLFETGVCLQKALKHLDMDISGYEIDVLRRSDREFLWKIYKDYSNKFKSNPIITEEIESLMLADNYINQRKNILEKDEIFISKAAILLCYCGDASFDNVIASDVINYGKFIDFSCIDISPIEKCKLRSGEIPEFVYDCHTRKGREKGKTDFDMTTAEQAALYPLRHAYFDEASWIYTYEDDFLQSRISLNEISMIREFARTREANPVKHIPY